MLKVNGKNDFEGYYDYFRWSADICENPGEVLIKFADLGLEGKCLQSVHAIGRTEDICTLRNGGLQRSLQKSGVDLRGLSIEEIESMTQAPLPCEVILREPIQIVFTDGTTLELLPLPGGRMRMGKNSIPAGMTTGMNRSDVDLTALLGAQLSGRPLKELGLTSQQETTTTYRLDVEGEWPFEEREVRSFDRGTQTFCYALEFSDGFNICLLHDRGLGYTAQLRRYSNPLEVPYGQVKAATRKVEQVELIPGGTDGGEMWTGPGNITKDSEEPKEFSYASWGFSVDCDRFCDFLVPLLNRYYDAGLQNRVDVYGSFDCYYSNYYTYEAVEKLLADVERIMTLLKEDYEAPELEEVKKRFYPSTFTDDYPAVSREDVPAWIRANIHIAIDFYERFVAIVRTLMREAPDCDCIIFCGP